MSENIDVLKINDEVQETLTDKLLDIRDLATVLQELTSNQQFDFTEWKFLGLYLGLYERTLKAIEVNCRGQVRKCLMECISSWLKGEDGVRDTRGGGSNWISLVVALDAMGEREVANNIRMKYDLSDLKATIQNDKPATNYSPTQISDYNDDQQKDILTIKNLVEVKQLLKDGSFKIIKWFDLGVYLGLSYNDLKTIEHNYPRDAEQCLTECLAKWLTDDIEATLGKLAIAAGKAGEGKAGEISVAVYMIKKINKWLEEGEVELKVTRINMHGAPGAGKTCSQRLLLNEPPPEKLTDSTPIACRAAKATRISIDDDNKKWETVDESEMLNQLASDLKKAPNETKQERTLIKVNEAQLSTAAPNHLSEPSLEEQTEKKPTEKKPTDMEVIIDISDALETGNAKSLSRNWVYFIDSGGQPAYRELLPLFTRAAALNIITIDLTKGLNEKKCEYHYRISEHTSPINTDLKYSNLGIIRSAISSEAMLNLIEIPYVSDSESEKLKPPHYLILGTRKELVDKEKLEKMNKSLISLDLKNVISSEPGKSVIFPVNTLLPAGSKERQEASVELCTAISNCNLEMTIELPIRLFAFEISLQKEARNKKQSFLTREEVIEIGKSLRLDDESDIDEALQYLHNVTIILYYHDVLPNIIFVDPEPILDVLSRLIAITYVEQSKLHLIAKASDERIRLKECGLFEEDLLRKIGQQQKIFDQDFKSSHMIKLLKHLHIIAEVKNKKEKEDDHHHIVTDIENKEKIEYFFPCALPSYDELKAPSTEIQPLLIGWKISNSGTTTLAIPQGLFPLTVVHLLEREDVDFSEGFYKCLDAMSLCVNDEYTINIINRCTHIEIRFYDEKKYCPEIRKLVEDTIKNSGNDLKVSKKYSLVFAFKCPKNEQSYCIVKEDNCSTRCKCQPRCKVLQGDVDNSYRCWFSDSQSSSPVTKASSEVNKLNTSHLVKIRDLLKKHGYSGADYYDLGLRLGLLPGTLDVIEKDNKGDTKSCLRKCLTAWLQQADNVKSVGGPTYDTLIQALRDEEENAVADGIKRDINN